MKMTQPDLERLLSLLDSYPNGSLYPSGTAISEEILPFLGPGFGSTYRDEWGTEDILASYDTTIVFVKSFVPEADGWGVRKTPDMSHGHLSRKKTVDDGRNDPDSWFIEISHKFPIPALLKAAVMARYIIDSSIVDRIHEIDSL